MSGRAAGPLGALLATIRAEPAASAGALLWALGLGGLLFYLLVYVAHTANLAAYPYDLDQGEGYDVNSGWLIAQGRPIYTDNSRYPYYSSNYPPVYSVLLAPIVARTGPTLASGRLLSAGAALLTVILIGALVHWRTRDGPAAITAGLLYIGSTYVFHTTPLARVNALALLFALAGLACCVGAGAERPAGGSGRPRRGAGRRDRKAEPDAPARPAVWLAGAVLFFLLALFSKPTTMDAVAAGLLALLFRSVRTAVLTGAALGVLGGVIFLGIDLAHGGQFWVNVVVGNVNPFDWQQAVDYFRNFLEIHLIVVALAGWQVARVLRARRLGPFEQYWILSLFLALSVGKWGAGESYFLAPIAASAVLAGDALAALRRVAARRPSWLVLAGGLLLVQVILYAHGPLYRWGPLLADRGAQASVLSRWPGETEIRAAAELVETLRQAEGPVLLEDPSYGLVAGKEVVGNATHLRNVHLAGYWSPDNLVADLRERRFSWVVLNAELYPEPVLAAIGRYYYLYEEYEINGTRQRLFAPGEE